MFILLIAVLLIAGAISFFYFSYNDGESITLQWLDQTGVFPLAWVPYVILLLILILIAAWVIAWLFTLPGNIRRGGNVRTLRKSRESLDRGLLEIQTGEFERGEATLTGHVEGSSSDAVKFLSAAKSAQTRGAAAQAEIYLKKASEASNEAALAVRVAQAEMMLERGDFRDAETLLNNLHQSMPKNAHILSLLAKALDGTGDAKRLAEVTRLMRAKTKLPLEQIAPLELSAWIKQLKDGGGEEIARIWESLPAEGRSNEDVTSTYVQRLIENREHDKAEAFLARSLSNRWSEKLAGLYGEIEPSNSAKQLETAERWLTSQPHSAALTLSAGMIAARRQLWGKARENLIKSAQLDLNVEVCSELGQVLEAMGDADKAKDCFKSAALLARGKAPTGPFLDVQNLPKHLIG